MNEAERAELERLKLLQSRLEQDLSLLSGRLEGLEQRLNTPPPQLPSNALPPPVPVGLDSPRDTVNTPVAAPQPAPTFARSAPPVISPEPALRQAAQLKPPAPAASSAGATETFHEIKPTKESSLEMRVGTYWLVRVGIVVLLTGLVLSGYLAYQNYISQLGPGGKVFLLYLASVTLMAGGGWWQRQAAKESLRDYAEVLFAGGLAALYFTTYAAHYMEPLRIISSPFVDGVLLLACAALMVWIADRKKSEVLALFAVLLAFYASIITRAGLFTLFSNLLLTAAAVTFLLRNRWAALSFASAITTYLAYAFWRFFSANAAWQQGEHLWTGGCFLLAYWLVFTVAVFLSKAPKLAGESRAAFLTLNNGAFFALFLLTMLQARQGGFWKFSLCFGAVLLVLAELSKRTLSSEPLAKNFYLTQGLLLITLGFVSKFTGLQLALLLAIESVVLLMLCQERRNLILLMGANASSALAIGWGMDGMRQFDQKGLILGMALGSLMLLNVLLLHHGRKPSNGRIFRPQIAYFTILALLIWLIATWNDCPRAGFPLVLAAEALLLTFSIYLLRITEMALLAQGYMVLAQVAFFLHFGLGENPLPPWWNPMLLILMSLVLGQWWQAQKLLSLRLLAASPGTTTDPEVLEPARAIALVYCWAALAISVWWIWQDIPARERIWVSAALGLCIFLFAGWRRKTSGLVFSAIYTVIALALFWLPLIEGSRVYWPNLIVILLLLGQRQIAKRFPERYPLASSVHGTVILVGGLSLWRFLSCWVLEAASGFYLTASWSGFALVLFTVGIVLRERMYRWLGLSVLASALGRVVVFDVWKLETLYRILSLMALGIVLLVLGFVYNKYQEKLREWL